jgi:translation elongation factor EF-Tu-like GTPase
MVNQEIVEGLRLALSRGYTLEKAMMSFYNAGYKKEDIENAARELYSHPSQSLSHPHKKTPEEFKKPIEEVKPLIGAISITEAVDKTEVKEAKKIGKRISRYEEKPKGRLISILLVILLLILLSGLAGIIFYKDQLISFFSGLF